MQRNLQDLVNPFNRFNLQVFLNILRNFLEIANILFGNDHGLDSPPVGRQQFFLQPANRQHLATQSDLAGHRHIGPDGDLGQRGNQCGTHADAGARAVLRCRTFRHVDMNVALLVEVRRHAEALRPATHHGQCRRDRLDHHVTQRAGLDQLPLARHHGRLDGQQFAAHLGPRQAGDLADLVLLLGQAVTVLPDAEEVFKRVSRHGHAKALLAHMLLDRLAADLGNLPLKAPHTCLASVVTNHVADCRRLELQLALLQAIGLGLLGRQVFHRDVDLLVLGVARQANDFHAVQQGRRDVHGVGRAEEHHVREVVVDFQIVVVEVVVLLGIQHLEQRRSRIATHVLPHLVDLIEQEQRVAHPDLGHFLDQATRHRTDIGTAVATNLRLVAHPTQGHADKLAICRMSDGFRQRRLAHTGRPHQAEHRPLDGLHPLLHGEVFENAFLDLFEAIVIGIEDRLCTRQIEAHLAFGFPWHIDQPIDVGAHHGRLGRHRRHLLELVQLCLGLGISLFGHAGVVDALLELFDLVMPFVAVTEFLLNGLHLLVQVVLALTALHLLLDPATNALLYLQQVDLRIQQGQNVLDARGKVGDLEDFLLLLDLQRHVGRHGVDQPTGLIDAVQRRQHLARHLLAQLHILLELAEQAADENFGLALGSFQLVDQRHLYAVVIIHVDETPDRGTLLAFDQDLDSAIRQLEQLQHSCHGTYAIKSVLARIVVRRVPLCQQEDLLVAGHGGFQCLDRLFAADEQRDDHVWVDHDVTQRQKRQFDCCLHDFGSTAAIWP
ncbi:hypothetical protein D9M68_434180 [compost metagenome]